VMAVVLGLLRQLWATSIPEAITLTLAGIAIVTFGLRAFRILGPDELDVLKRASIPGKHLLVQWLTPRGTT